MPTYVGVIRNGDPHTKFLEVIDTLQGLLPAEGKWALGDQFSVADVAIAPFIARAEILFQNEFLANEGDGAKILEALQSPRYTRFWQYFQDLKARPSFIKTFDAVRLCFLPTTACFGSNTFTTFRTMLRMNTAGAVSLRKKREELLSYINNCI